MRQVYFTPPYQWRYYITHPWELIDHYRFIVKEFVQRGWRGYSDNDHASVFTYNAEVMVGLLTLLKEHGMGYPMDACPTHTDEWKHDHNGDPFCRCREAGFSECQGPRVLGG